jgi:arginine repressor
MLTQLIIRLLAPVILEIIKELLEKIASGQQVQLTEELVKSSMIAKESQISQGISSLQIPGFLGSKG